MHTIQYAADRPTRVADGPWHLGGAASRSSPRQPPWQREAPHCQLRHHLEDPADTERGPPTRQAWADIGRFGPGGVYLNFAGFGEEKEALVRAGYGANYERLAALKAQYDPTNLFRMNQNIKPA
jgi:hypothetical protein